MDVLFFSFCLLRDFCCKTYVLCKIVNVTLVKKKWEIIDNNHLSLHSTFNQITSNKLWFRNTVHITLIISTFLQLNWRVELSWKALVISFLGYLQKFIILWAVYKNVFVCDAKHVLCKACKKNKIYHCFQLL